MRTASTALRALAVIAAGGALALPASASAAEQVVITPIKLTGTLGGAGGLTLGFTVADSLGGIPSPLAGIATIDLPAGGTYNATGFPTCPLATITAAVGAPPSCPAGSKIGSGTATGQAVIGGTGIVEPAVLDVYLTQTNPITLEFWGNGTNPIAETLAFPGTFARASSPYGEQVTIQVPTITSVPGGPDVSITQVAVKFGATRSVTTTKSVKVGRSTVRKRVKTTVGLVTLPKKCSGTLHWGANLMFQDGTSAGATGTSACP